MADPLGPLGSSIQDPLDELGGLVGQTLNIFDRQGQAASDKLGERSLSVEDPLNVYGTRNAMPDVVGQSLDLDLLGAPSSSPAAPSAMARGNAVAPDTDIPLTTDDVPFGYPKDSGEELATTLSNSSGHVKKQAEGGLRGSLLHSSGDGPSTSAGNGAAATADTNEPSLVRVWIREPERMEATNKLGIRTAYFTYLVRTESQLPSMRTDGTEVRRRFSEFDALHKLVKSQYRGYIIPPLPEKSFIDAKLAHEDFLRLRRADLQAFLRGMAQHPALRESEALRLFLLQPGELQYNPAWIALLHSIGSSPDAHEGLMSSLVPSVAGASTAKAAAGLSSLVAWVKHSMLLPGGKRDLDEDELQLRHVKELMRDLERLLQLCCESARMMCSHMESLAADQYELGRNMGMLSKWEETLRAHSGSYTEAGFSAAKRAADCKQLSYASARQHTVWKTASVKTAASLVALHDYYIIMPEAVAALEERERCLEQIFDLEAELAAKHSDLNKGSGKGQAVGRDRRAYTLTNAVDRLEEQLKVCRDTYVTIKRRNMEELRRLHLSREKDFHEMMANFSNLQASLMQASADMWRTMARQFSGEAAPPTEPTDAPEDD